MEQEPDIGRKIVARARTRARCGERLVWLSSATSRLSSTVAACSAVELYIYRGDEAKALAALSLFAILETTRELMTVLEKKRYDLVVTDEIEKARGGVGDDTDRSP